MTTEMRTEGNPVICVTKVTIDSLLKEENATDLIALYMFYNYTAKWQKTNQPKCTTEYAANGLKITPARVRKTRKHSHTWA